MGLNICFPFLFSLSRLFYTHMTMSQESRNNLYIGNDTNQHFHWLSKDFSLHQRNTLTYYLRRKFYRKLPFTEVGDENKIFFNPYYQNLYISVSVKILRMHVYYDAYIYLMTMVSLSFCPKIRSVNLSLIVLLMYNVYNFTRLVLQIL